MVLMKFCKIHIHMDSYLFSVVNDIDELARYKRSRQFAVAQKRGGVVEECCFSSCSYENLLLYCSQVRTNNSMGIRWMLTWILWNVKHVNYVLICVSDGTIFRRVALRSDTNDGSNEHNFVFCIEYFAKIIKCPRLWNQNY